MADKFYNDFYEYFKKNTPKSFTNKHGEQWTYKPPRRKAQSYTQQVLDYLADEYGITYDKLSRETIEFLLDMIDGSTWKGENVPNSAALVMEILWQNGFPRPDTN